MSRTRVLADWFDHRTGFRALLRAALYERIPGGARWRYVWGSALSFALFTQFVTGVVLWAAYSANAQGAWESVYYIQNAMWGGWLLRGVHHYTAQVTVVLLGLHLMQVVVDGAYRAPREVNFWFGLALLFVIMGLSLTGYLLPWDQKGYWATKVTTSIASMTPVVGIPLQRLLVGGPEYGHHTLTRFFALHAGVLPAVLVGLVVGHVYLFRRHGVTTPAGSEKRPDGVFWPDQVLRDAVASLAVMATVLALVVWNGGAHLGAPADPTEPYAAARPEWYFLFLFQWLKYFPAGWEFVAAQVIPASLVVVVAAMPFVARWRLGHRFNLGLGAALASGIVMLTWLAVASDRADPEYRRAVTEAEAEAERVRELAAGPAGIPATGARELLRADPLTQGPKIFAANCASCHRYDGHDGLGVVPDDEPSASDLAGFGSRAWLAGLLDPERVTTLAYFGGTEHRTGRMARFVTRGVAGFSAEERAWLDAVVVAVSAQAELPAQREADAVAADQVREGLRAFGPEGVDCARCHTLGAFGDGDVGPELTGWGSRDWIVGMVRDPTHPSYYGEDNDRMPSFRTEGILTDAEIGLVADWLRGSWYRPEDTAVR